MWILLQWDKSQMTSGTRQSRRDMPAMSSTDVGTWLRSWPVSRHLRVSRFPLMLGHPHLLNRMGQRGRTWHTYSTLYVAEDTVNSLPTFVKLWATRWPENGPKWQSCKIGTFFRGPCTLQGTPSPKFFVPFCSTLRVLQSP